MLTPPSPISLRPEEISETLITSEFEAMGIDKAQFLQNAQKAVERQGNEQLQQRFNEMMVNYEKAVKAGRWDTVVSGTGKIVLLVVGAIALAIFGLLGGALLEQSQHSHPTLSAPAPH